MQFETTGPIYKEVRVHLDQKANADIWVLQVTKSILRWTGKADDDARRLVADFHLCDSKDAVRTLLAKHVEIVWH